MPRFISLIDHGAYDVDPMDCPLCPVCDQPMWVNEDLAIQTVDAGPGNADLVRLTHRVCIEVEDDDEDEGVEGSA